MSSTHYHFSDQFHAIYDQAVALYAKGQRGAASYFSSDELAFLSANGITAQHLYDYAEDANNYGDPTYDRALGIELVRRDYFLNVQHGKPSGIISDSDTWPVKSEELRGIAWLPRILPKARAKLHGELPDSMMYSCAGDRKFFTTNNIEPSEFLTLLWRHGDNDDAIANWVAQRAQAKA